MLGILLMRHNLSNHYWWDLTTSVQKTKNKIIYSCPNTISPTYVYFDDNISGRVNFCVKIALTWTALVTRKANND